ncbi:hypothetical protein CLOL250_01029 [Clostridium sp. L2-50]|nr:hypothetical protein CLOL250_01029 [Clostridium sp. L2-50]
MMILFTMIIFPLLSWVLLSNILFYYIICPYDCFYKGRAMSFVRERS